jgi:hypothetical protein
LSLGENGIFGRQFGLTFLKINFACGLRKHGRCSGKESLFNKKKNQKGRHGGDGMATMRALKPLAGSRSGLG